MQSSPATAIACLPLLSAEECDAIAKSLDEVGWADAPVAAPDPNGRVQYEVRRCDLAAVRDGALLSRLEKSLFDLNRTLHGFDLKGFSARDPVAAMRYREGGHFAWHLDNGVAQYAQRKLSFAVQLSDPADYEGGDLEFAMYAQEFGGAAAHAGHREQVRRRGAITVFPAFHLHRVTRVTKGVRVAIVGWVHGPSFR